ncbi:MAG TPA: ABC transporter permease [Terracidiphilus sp.]|nr:ABC transporter permease [Terracidiphilus sp.]
MNGITQLIRRLSILFSRQRYRAELDEEMAFHRAEGERALKADGMSPDAAHKAAARQLGNVTRLQEQSHDVVGFRAETILQDIRFALRQMRQRPAFALTAVLILALGMGVSVAIFGFVDAALLQPLPYVDSNRLVDVDEMSPTTPRTNISRSDYDDWKRLNRSFSSLDVYTGMGFLWATPSGAIPVPAARVSDGFFSTLGVKPLLGRGFLLGEDQPGKAKIAVLSYGTWMKRLGGRPNVVGESISLSGSSYTIVGVLPREFFFAPRGGAELYVPLLDKNGCEQRRSCHNFDGIARLRDGVSVQAATHEMKSIAARLETQYPDSNHGQSAEVQPFAEFAARSVKPVLLTLLAGAGLLLLIACVNVSSLLLVRSESRRREIAVRGALGATPVRLIRQFVTEGLLLAGVGCLGGIAIAVWLMKMLTRLVPDAVAQSVPFLHLVGLNLHTALFAASIAVLSAILLAATPGLRLSFQDIRVGLGEGGRASAGRFWQRLGANLVVVELAIAVVLLVGAGLLGQSFYRLLRVENGFDTDHLATVQIIVPDTTYSKDEQTVALYKEIERRLSALPGVQGVGFTSSLPVQCNCNTDWIRIVGKPFHGEHNEVTEREVTPGYLATLKARVVRGRWFDENDTLNKPRVTVINEALAAKYFPGEDAIGKMIGGGDLSQQSLRQVVGIIANVREGGPDEELWPSEYFSMYREPDTFFAIVVRTAQDESAMLPSIVGTLHQIDHNLGVYGEQTMTEQIESSQSSLLHRFASWLVGGFAAVALVLGVVGLYGVIAYSVSQRTREIGVRMALGAQRGAVCKMIMRQAGWLTITGISIGIACAVGASMAMRKLLFGVEAWDVRTLATVALVLGSAALAASFLPARRAASVSPTEALRAE